MTEPQPIGNAQSARDTPSSPEDVGDALAEKLRFLLGYYIDKHGAEMIREAFRERDHAVRAEADKAYGYLRRVFEICAPQCEPLPDLMGLCTQIDNLIAGYRIAIGLESSRKSEERTSDE